MGRLIKLFIQGCPSLGLHNLVGMNLSVRLFRAALNKFHLLSAVIFSESLKILFGIQPFRI